MSGGRKVSGYRWATVVLTGLAVASLFFGADATEVFKEFAFAQSIVSAGFFSFNGLEHWSNAYGKKQNGDT